MISFHVKNPSVQLQGLWKPSCQRQRHVGLFTCTDPCVEIIAEVRFHVDLSHVQGHATFDVTWNLYVGF